MIGDLKCKCNKILNACFNLENNDKMICEQCNNTIKYQEFYLICCSVVITDKNDLKNHCFHCQNCMIKVSLRLQTFCIFIFLFETCHFNLYSFEKRLNAITKKKNCIT